MRLVLDISNKEKRALEKLFNDVRMDKIGMVVTMLDESIFLDTRYPSQTAGITVDKDCLVITFRNMDSLSIRLSENKAEVSYYVIDDKTEEALRLSIIEFVHKVRKEVGYYILTGIVYALIFGTPFLLAYVGYVKWGLGGALICWGLIQGTTLLIPFADEVNMTINIVIKLWEKIKGFFKSFLILPIIQNDYDGRERCAVCKEPIEDGAGRRAVGIDIEHIHLGCEEDYNKRNG